MKRAAIILFSLLFIAMLPLTSGQFPSNNEWEFGWETEVEPSYDLALDGEKWRIEDTLVFFVDNPRVTILALQLLLSSRMMLNSLKPLSKNRLQLAHSQMKPSRLN